MVGFVLLRLQNYFKRVINRQRLKESLELCTSFNDIELGLEGIIANKKNNRDKIVLGHKVWIEGTISSSNNCTGKLEIGDYSYIGPNTRVWASHYISIGKNVFVSHNCNIMDSNTHPIDPELRSKGSIKLRETGVWDNTGVDCSDIIIEDDAWICENSCIMKGVKIGRAAIVAAGSVVTNDVPAWTIVAGVPARVVKHINH